MLFATTARGLHQPACLTTPVVIPRSRAIINHDDSIVFVGSCFGEIISSELQKLKFPKIASNPQGIAFNPHSISRQIVNSIDGKVWSENDLTAASDIIFSFNHHTSFTSLKVNMPEMLSKMNIETTTFKQRLENASHLFITLGSAKVHTLKTTGGVVSNCHKQPSALFESRILTVDEVVSSLSQAIDRTNAATNIVLTVSPVRHTRDTLQVNSLSKAILRIACTQLAEMYGKRVSYFPSYEIMIDELRDYRYYEADLIHPSSVARKVIFDRLRETFFSPDCTALCDEIESVTLNAQHRVTPSLASCREYQLHLEKTRGQMESLQARCSHIDLTAEIDQVRNKMA